MGDEDDPRIICNEVTNGNEEGGRTAMEKCLQKDPDINVVYTINEPAAVGAYEALKQLEKMMVVFLLLQLTEVAQVWLTLKEEL